MRDRRMKEAPFEQTCPYGSDCTRTIYGKTAESLEAEVRRHLSVAHGRSLGPTSSRSRLRRDLAERKRIDRDYVPSPLESVVAPRGAKQYFDSAGAAEMLALVLPRRVRA